MESHVCICVSHKVSKFTSSRSTSTTLISCIFLVYVLVCVHMPRMNQHLRVFLNGFKKFTLATEISNANFCFVLLGRKVYLSSHSTHNLTKRIGRHSYCITCVNLTDYPQRLMF